MFSRENILKIDPSNFTWSLWRSGTLLDLGIEHNTSEFIYKNREKIKKYAIGYCQGSELVCRPKKNCYAVMFQKGDLLFWTHLTKQEFEVIFK